MEIKDILQYEIHGSWFAGWIPAGTWLGEVASRYFVWKTKRKWRRFVRAREFQPEWAADDKKEGTA